MDSGSTTWWGRHGWTVAVLLTAFAMAFAIRTIFAYPVIQQFGNLYVYAGGSDSYYHSRVMQYIIANHRTLVLDPLLRYPAGAINPREPLFDWMNASLGLAFAPLFGGNAVSAGAFFLNLQAPLWAALTVFPIYLIGREVGDRRTGLIAAIIFPFLPASINESIFGYANYLSFYTFVILVVIYAYIRLVKTVGSRRWVEDYRSPRSVWLGLKAFVRNDRPAVKWAVFTGVAFGTLALAWQGYTYIIAIIGVFIIVAMIIERIRRVDSFGLYVSTLIVGLVGFPMAMPYYYFQHEFAGWFDLPLLLFFGILLLLLPFLFMREWPWVVSVPSLVAIFLAGAAVLFVTVPTYLTEIVTGQGYFIKTLIYSTVAEAQAPSFDSLVISYGIVTFFLAFIGMGLLLWELVRGRFRRWQLVFLIFAILSLYLPFSASKFLLLGSPAFALLPAEALRRFWDMGRFADLRQNLRTLTDTRSRLAAFRRSFKLRHVIVVVVVVGLVVPNVWYSMDAGLPSNSKAGASQQVYNTLPSWLRPASSQSSSWYFGAAGSALDTPNLYDSAAYTWLSQQDTATPAPSRPAFVSWWDYGFQAVDQGQHPTVADNFQNGIDPSGQFLLAQNQSIAIGVLAVTLLTAEQTASGQLYLPSQLNGILKNDGLNLSILHTDLVNMSRDYQVVVSDPALYLPVNAATLTTANAMYMVSSYYIAGALSPNGVAKVYNDIQRFTGWSVRYSMADSRLIPFSASNTGIYYAPADLTGRIIDASGNPETYFNITILGSDGHYYSPGQLPADVTAVSSQINYYAPFYNSMIYHIYFGYNGTDIGLGVGIPGLLGSLTNYPVEPGWMMSHFEVVYQTAYYCPTASLAQSQGCYYATNKPTALALAQQKGGVANTNASAYFGGGESMLAYYPGQTLTGTVELPSGAPVAGARVTVEDGWGIPHQTVLTGSGGQFTVVLPPGNDTLNVTTGTFQGLSQQGNILLASVPIEVPAALGFSYDAPTISKTVVVGNSTVQGVVYWNENNGTFYDPTVDTAIPSATAVLWGVLNANPIHVATDAGGTFQLTNVAPGVYNYSILYDGTNYSQTKLYVDAGASPVNASAGLTPANFTGSVLDPSGRSVAGATVTITSPTGRSAQTVTDSGGGYKINTLGPGNYTVTASGPGANNRSLGAKVVVGTIGEHPIINLTEFPTAPVTLTAVMGGLPVSNLPVRLIPIPSGANATVVDPYLEAQANATILYTNAQGQLRASLPVGNYSLYALTYNGTTPYAAVGRVSVLTAGESVVGPDLVLSRAAWLTGTVHNTAGGNSTSIVIAYSASGVPTVTTTTNGSFALALPLGGYSLLTVQTLSSGGPTYAALTAAPLSAPTTVSVDPTTSIVVSFPVNTALANSTLYPASHANVTVRIGTNGPWVTSFSSTNGTVHFIVPGSLAVNESYCVNARATGYLPTQECGLSPSGLQDLTRLPISFAPIALTVTVSGAPSKTPILLNLTATSPTAGNYSLAGGPTFTLGVNPGNYSMTAFASGVANVSQYHTGTALAISLPLGTSARSASLALLYEVNSTGTLLLPKGMDAANVTLELSAPGITVSVNGSRFEHGFYAPPSNYSAYAVGSLDALTYTNLTSVTVPLYGATTPEVALSQLGISVTGQLFAPNGTALPLAATLRFVSPSGASTSTATTNGNFTVSLPGAATYSILANFTASMAGPNGSYLVEFSSSAAANPCRVGSSESVCPVTLSMTTLPVWFNGSLYGAGSPGPVPGSVTLFGPYPSMNRTVYSVPSGTFALSLLPGSYAVYATGTVGANPLANLTTVTLLPTSDPIVVSLAPTWNDRITVQPPSPIGGASSAQLLVRSTSMAGAFVDYPNVLWGTAVSVALPVGTYSLRAQTEGAPYGANASASANATVSLRSGNVATALSLTYQFVYTVAGVASGPSVVYVPAAGGVVTFGVGLTDYGNAPATVHLSASPAYWNFTTSLNNVTLQPTGPGRTVSGEVRFVVPAGEVVSHPTIVLSVELANGTQVGSVSEVPKVQVEAVYGLSIQQSPVSSITLGLTTVDVPFAVTNTGNLAETVAVSITDRAVLASLGWNSTLLYHTGKAPATLSIGPGSSVSLTLNLSQVGPAAVPPGRATVSATVLNASNSVEQSANLYIPTATIGVRTIIGVTGPGVGVAPVTYAQWLLILLALLPALLVGGGAAIYRWNRSRRWRR